MPEGKNYSIPAHPVFAHSHDPTGHLSAEKLARHKQPEHGKQHDGEKPDYGIDRNP